MPELASRAHVERILPVIDEALRAAGIAGRELDAVAVANTPGLAGSLLVGLAAAKALALAWQVPLVAINHLQAHIYACRLAAGEDVFPCVGLIASGGHSSLYRCRTPLEFDLLGGTIDDAAGEAFDKVASLLGLGFPGGPAIERAAKDGNPRGVSSLPRPLLKDRQTLDFSFSGLKTAVRYRIAAPGAADRRRRRCRANRWPTWPLVSRRRWSTAWSASRCWRLEAHRPGNAVRRRRRGGERPLCARLESEAAARGVRLSIPPLRLCTDNAVMGAIAVERLKAGLVESLDLDVYPGLVRGATPAALEPVAPRPFA